MSSSRLDEIRKKLRDQIQEETDKSKEKLGSTFRADGKSSFREKLRENIQEETNRAFLKPSSLKLSENIYSKQFSSDDDESFDHIHEPAVSVQPNAITKVAPRTECKALCIGMNKYISCNPLTNCSKDAQDMAFVMNHLGYEVTSIYDRTSEETKEYLDTFLKSIKEGDDVVLTFSGHGSAINSEPHLYPIDAASPGDAINLYSEFIDHLKFTGAKSAVIIIDACRGQERIFHNEIVNYEDSEQEDLIALEEESLEEWFEELTLNANTHQSKVGSQSKSIDLDAPFGHAIVFSSAHNQLSQDWRDLENSLFTHFFKTEMLNPSLSLREIFENVREKVKEASDGTQIPAFHDDLSSKYYFYPK